MNGHAKRIRKEGADPATARGLLLMIHGRGASAEDILGLALHLEADGFAYWAPEATHHTWYPYPFVSPIAQNEPWLSSALAVMGEAVAEAGQKGIPPQRIWLVGFSQGACLSLEFAARNPTRWGGVLAFSGGLIGERLEPEGYAGDFAGTPIFIGSSDPDPHIPVPRVRESARLLHSMGASVQERIYPGMGHRISEEELAEANRHAFPGSPTLS